LPACGLPPEAHKSIDHVGQKLREAILYVEHNPDMDEIHHLVPYIQSHSDPEEVLPLSRLGYFKADHLQESVIRLRHSPI
jgi:hypothetical protein